LFQAAAEIMVGGMGQKGRKAQGGDYDYDYDYDLGRRQESTLNAKGDWGLLWCSLCRPDPISHSGRGPYYHV
jgi:hypothetical protein